jgi:hypothetical protein
LDTIKNLINFKHSNWLFVLEALRHSVRGRSVLVPSSSPKSRLCFPSMTNPAKFRKFFK